MIGMVGYFNHQCVNCGHEQMIQVNNDLGCIDYCKNCSWKPSYGEHAIPFNGRTYRPFKFCDTEQIQPNPYNQQSA